MSPVASKTIARALVFVVAVLPIPGFTQTPPLTISAGGLDSLYPGTCIAGAGCFPSVLSCSDNVTKVLGFTGDETHVAKKSVNFPALPSAIVVHYVTNWSAVNDFYLDSMTGFWLWSCALRPIGTDYNCPNLGYDTCRIDYAAFEQADASLATIRASVIGTHALFIQFSCGGPGCGNFASWTFLFDSMPLGAMQRTAFAAEAKAHAPKIALFSLAAARERALAGSHAALFDVHGRRLARVPAGNAGIVILARSIQ